MGETMRGVDNDGAQSYEVLRPNESRMVPAGHSAQMITSGGGNVAVNLGVVKVLEDGVSSYTEPHRHHRYRVGHAKGTSRISVGRHEDSLYESSIVVPDRFVSRKHAAIQARNGEVFIMNRRPTNGLAVSIQPNRSSTRLDPINHFSPIADLRGQNLFNQNLPPEWCWIDSPAEEARAVDLVKIDRIVELTRSSVYAVYQMMACGEELPISPGDAYHFMTLGEFGEAVSLGVVGVERDTHKTVFIDPQSGVKFFVGNVDDNDPYRRGFSLGRGFMNDRVGSMMHVKDITPHDEFGPSIVVRDPHVSLHHASISVGEGCARVKHDVRGTTHGMGYTGIMMPGSYEHGEFVHLQLPRQVDEVRLVPGGNRNVNPLRIKFPRWVRALNAQEMPSTRC